MFYMLDKFWGFFRSCVIGGINSTFMTNFLGAAIMTFRDLLPRIKVIYNFKDSLKCSQSIFVN